MLVGQVRYVNGKSKTSKISKTIKTGKIINVSRTSKISKTSKTGKIINVIRTS